MDIFDPLIQRILEADHLRYAVELGGALTLIGVSIWIDKKARAFILKEKEETKPTKRTIILRAVLGCVPVLRPLAAFLLIHLMFFAMESTGATAHTYEPVHQLLLAWLLIKAIRILTRQKVATWLIAGLILPMTLLAMVDLWQPLLAFLDTLALQVGSYRVTVYNTLEFIFVAVLLFWSVGKITGFLEQHLKSRRALSVSNRTLVIKLLQIFLYIVAFLLTLDILGIDLTALAVFSGALGVGLGFGLQKITSNFISGLILLFEKSVKSTDMVEMADGTYGIIKQISARYTLIQTYDGKEIMVPNEDFITQQVINWTHSDSRGRLEKTIGVAYGTDLKKARELIFEAINEHPDTLSDAENQCNLVEFGDSSINFLMRLWLNDFSKGRRRVMGEVLMAVWEKFEANNIEIPFPQRDLNFKGPMTIHYDEPGKSAKKPGKKKTPVKGETKKSGKK